MLKKLIFAALLLLPLGTASAWADEIYGKIEALDHAGRIKVSGQVAQITADTELLTPAHETFTRAELHVGLEVDMVVSDGDAGTVVDKITAAVVR